MPGEEPPAEIKELATWVEGRERLDIGSDEYLELSRKIYAFHAANLYRIGTVGMAPTLYIAKNSIGNVPTAFPPPRSWAGDLTAYADQLFSSRRPLRHSACPTRTPDCGDPAHVARYRGSALPRPYSP